MSSLSFPIAAQTSLADSRRSAAYIRVSTEDQNPDLQIIALEDLKPWKIYQDRDTGMNPARTAYKKLIDAITGDIIDEVWVYRLDRLGRDPQELIYFFNLLEKHDVKFVSLSEPHLTDWNQSPTAYLSWWVHLGLARFELLLLKDRQRRGIDAAKAAGKHLGRPRKRDLVGDL